MSETDTAAYEATDVREMLDQLEQHQFSHVENAHSTIEQFAQMTVENGTFYPDCSVTADLELTLRERLTGTRKQDLTAMLCLGLMLGAALERDVPGGSEREAAWKAGEFTLPESTLQDETGGGSTDGDM